MKLEKFNLKHESCIWWLRSAHSDYRDSVGTVIYSGVVYSGYTSGNFGVLPAYIII